jgi:hypothetical protein
MKGLLLAAALVAALTMAAPASAKPRHRHPPKPTGSTVAVIGDIPYGDALITEFPQDVQEINADPDVARVIHLGDIKNGSSRCDTSYFQARFAFSPATAARSDAVPRRSPTSRAHTRRTSPGARRSRRDDGL